MFANIGGTLRSLLQRPGNNLDDDLSDCSFNIKNSYENHEVIRGHRVVFGSASPKFKAALYANADAEVDIYGITAAGFCFVKRFLYKDRTLDTFESASQAIEVANFAHHWELKSLYECAVNSCFSTLHLSGLEIWALCEMLLQHANDAKYKIALLFLRQRCSEVISSEAWAKFASKNLFMYLLREENLNVDSEKQLLDAVVKWGYHRASAAGDTTSSVWPYITHLLPDIRIRNISPSDFIDFVERDDINANCFSYHIRNSILMCLTTNDEKFLPLGFGSNAKKRGKVGKQTVFTGCTMNAPMSEVLDTPMHLNFTANKSVYLFGIRLFSLEFLNFQKHLNLACHIYKVDNGQHTLVAEGEFRGMNEEDKKNHVTLQYPFLLKEGEQYQVKVANRKDVGRLVPHTYVKFVPKNTRVQSTITFHTPYQPGDVYGLFVECPKK
ncbi:uncharacterized protein LOC135945992 [Cloeon dipterum]|uniref:uncharacterized protein LOC135945992 n=1 Tax=Cloeon dipterum TaxID=197152 RepID=UPI00321FDBF2